MAEETHHIERIGNTRANLQSNLDVLQIAIETDNNENLVYKDDDGTYHLVADQKISGGSSGNNTFGDITVDALTMTGGLTLGGNLVFTSGYDRSIYINSSSAQYNFYITSCDNSTGEGGHLYLRAGLGADGDDGNVKIDQGDFFEVTIDTKLSYTGIYGSDSAALRIYGADTTNEILSIYVASDGRAVFNNQSGTDSNKYFDFYPEDASAGLLLHSSDSTAYANFSVTNTTVDYLSLNITNEGQTHFIFDANSYLGIAVIPTAPLHVKRDVVGGSPWIGQVYIEAVTDDTDAGISLKTTRESDRVWSIVAGIGTPASPFRIYDSTNSLTRLYIDTSLVQLDNTGTFSVYSVSGDCDLNFGENGTGGNYGYVRWNAANDLIQIGTQAGGVAFTMNESGYVTIGSTYDSPVKFTIDGGFRLRNSSSTRYRADLAVSGAGTTTLNSYDDTGVVYMPFQIDSSDFMIRLGTNTMLEMNATSGDISIVNDVVIGTSAGTNPGYRLDVMTDAASTYVASFFNDGNDANRYGIRIQCGLDTPTTGTPDIIWVALRDGDDGNCGYLGRYSGTSQVISVSDESLKHNITDTKSALTDIAALPVRDYAFVENGDKVTGFVAQELAQVFPEMVCEMDGLKMIAPTMLIPKLVKAVQELRAEVELLKKL